ncbi:MAG: matrixin family metalloprotease [Nitrosopumilus sp.]|nr:matrixin family metalloprotease [Nitrosopumilus sp.]MDH3487898.1 matrixin family metalloprotease [Nitrosopumilus sp.]
MKFTENIEGIDEWPHSWPEGEISYRLNNKTKDVLKERLQHKAVTVSLRAWQLRIRKLKFRRERTPGASVDFNVSFEPLSHFDNMKGVLAHAYFPGQGDISGDCHINDEWNWTTHSALQKLSTPPLVPVLIHEFGHSLGLRHDTTAMDSIMYPSFDLGKKKNSLHPRDVARIQERYGARTISQRIIDYFRNRRDMGWDFD